MLKRNYREFTTCCGLINRTREMKGQEALYPVPVTHLMCDNCAAYKPPYRNQKKED